MAEIPGMGGVAWRSGVALAWGARGGYGSPTLPPWAARAAAPPAGRVASTAFSHPSSSQAAESGPTPAPPVPRGLQTAVPPGGDLVCPPDAAGMLGAPLC